MTPKAKIVKIILGTHFNTPSMTSLSRCGRTYENAIRSKHVTIHSRNSGLSYKFSHKYV